MPPLSPSQKYLRAYGLVGPQVSPEMQWQMKERERAGQDVLNGKYGTGLPAALGLNPDGSPAGGSLGDQYQQAADAAKAATDARDKEIRGVLDQRIQSTKDLFARTSGGMFSNIYRNQRRQVGTAVMNDAARGFYRSGAGNSKTAQLARHDELTQAEGEVAQKQALLDAQFQKDKADYVERISDVPPDMNQLIGLERQMGSGNTSGMFGGNPYGQMPNGGYANVYGQSQQPQTPIRDQGPSNYTTLRPEQPKRQYTLGAPGGLQAVRDAKAAAVQQPVPGLLGNQVKGPLTPPQPGPVAPTSPAATSMLDNPMRIAAGTAFDHALQYGLNGTRRRRSFANTYARS